MELKTYFYREDDLGPWGLYFATWGMGCHNGEMRK